MLVAMLSLVTLPGCFNLHKHNGKIVKVSLGRNPALAKTLTNKAAIHLQRDEIALAEPLLFKAVRADRTYAPAHNNLGLAYFENFDLFRAALSFQEAMRLAPQSPEPQNNLGLTFEAAGRPQSAIEHYQAAHDLAPTEPEFLGNLLRARLRTNETPEMLREELRQLLFIERRPDWIDWIEDQLELVSNPNFDRGPESPELGDLTGRGDQEPFDESKRVIYDSGPVAAQPAPMNQPYDNQYRATPAAAVPVQTQPPSLTVPPVMQESTQPALQSAPGLYSPQPAASTGDDAIPYGSVPTGQPLLPPTGRWETPVPGFRTNN
jgi:Flp pilus assembly protein TadD